MSWAQRKEIIRRAMDAQAKLSYDKTGKVYEDGRLVYDSDAQEDQTLYTEEEELRLNLYGSALEELATEDWRYNSNYNCWQRWGKPWRLWWITQIEAQARAGKQTIGVDVVTRAVDIRLRS